MHFLAWLKQRPSQVAEQGFETQLDVVLKMKKFGEGTVYWYADNDPFFPPIDPRENREWYKAHFRNRYMLTDEKLKELMESFDEAVDEFDPPRLLRAGVA